MDGRVCSACRGLDLGFSTCVTAGPYRGPLRSAVHALKYRRAAAVAWTLGGLMADAWLAAGGTDWAWPVAVVPVPADPGRVSARGVDHTAALATAFAAALGLEPPLRAAKRRRPTAQQVGLSAAARRANQRGSVVAVGRTPFRAVIVDDVVTTGATCSEVARALRRGGCHEVHVCAVARAWPPPARGSHRRV